jgi:glycosyltransferase involved in cell wall biosynthesis
MVSVIIPTYNRSPFLKKAIESVLSQDFHDFELIVVDDGSIDDTPETVSAFKRGIIYIKQENTGPAGARNAGIQRSTRPFIAFLDSDDRWAEGKLSEQIKEMTANPDYFISHTDEIWHKNGRLLNQKNKHKKPHGYIFDKCLSLCAVSMSTVMIRRELFDAVGFFDESFPCCEDYEFWLRVSVKEKFLFIERPLTFKDGGRPDQVSSIYSTGMDRFRIRAIKNLLEANSLNAEQKNFAIRELGKKCGIYGNGCVKHGRKDEGFEYLNLPARYR